MVGMQGHMQVVSSLPGPPPPLWPQISCISQWVIHDITDEKNKWQPPEAFLFFMFRTGFNALWHIELWGIYFKLLVASLC